MSNHTPGPWRTGDMFNTVFGPPNTSIDGGPSPKTIATVQKGNKANARLIAAAPDLLAALQTIALHAPSLDAQGVRDIADAAIAKAVQS